MDFLSAAGRYQDQMVEDLIELIAIPSLLDEDSVTKGAPFGKEIRRALDYMLEKGAQDGFEVKDVDGYAGRISYGQQKTSVSMLGHLDVVPVSGEWLRNPFEGFVKDGFVVGRGSSDDKGPSIAAYYALKILKENNYKFNHRIDLILGTDEETHMRCIEYYKQHETVPLKGIVPDSDFPGIYGEKGILNFDIVLENNSQIESMTAGQRPNIVIDFGQAILKTPIDEKLAHFYGAANNLLVNIKEKSITFTGKAYHASQPYKGNNAGVHLLNFISVLYDDKSLKKVVNLISDSFGLGAKVDFDSPLMGLLTLNVGIISVNQDEIRITIDIRYPIEVDYKEIIDQFSKQIDGTIENISDSSAHYVDPQSEIVLSAMAAYQKITKDTQSVIKTMGGGTYARTLNNHIAFGADFENRFKPDWVGSAHEINEAMEIESMVLACAIYCEAMLGIAEVIE